MAQLLCRFWRECDGQDILEYSLIIAFIAISAIWILGAGRPAVRMNWTTANSHVRSSAMR
jgi:Flp pilus assembly pilin Flp